MPELGGVGLDFAAWIRSRRREEVGERGANMTDLLCGCCCSSWCMTGETERVDGGVKVAAGDGGWSWFWLIRPVIAASVFRFFE